MSGSIRQLLPEAAVPEFLRQQPEPKSVDATIAERGARYGATYMEQARVTQSVKRAMADSAQWNSLKDDQRDALEMIAVKVGRILTGDPDYLDSWHDIAGYARLIEKRLTPQETV